MDNKRRHLRYPVIREMDQSIQLSIGDKTIPSLLVDLSAGGVSLLTYDNVVLGTEITLSINLCGYQSKELSGHVVWTISKGEMWRLGISFSKIDPLDFRHINRMAFDFNDCETKLKLGVNDVCVEKCSYFQLCQKPTKIKSAKQLKTNE
ncbi:MAG: PilZ domain-containing protein [Elusimicrobia bacterium]|nr:PilZ domain-containing protein [Candidatus Liberimonas magnetica]